MSELNEVKKAKITELGKFVNSKNYKVRVIVAERGTNAIRNLLVDDHNDEVRNAIRKYGTIEQVRYINRSINIELKELGYGYTDGEL